MKWKKELSLRLHAEEPHPVWSPFAYDTQKILSSNAYARIHDKTQVVYLLPHDHITNRSLHVQLVSLFARNIGIQTGLDCSLLEAIALGHDLGHPPFGHEGEMYLCKIAEEKGLGCFSHALHSCRLAEVIDPMNLTLAVLDGFLCHDGGLKADVVQVSEEDPWQAYEQKKALRQKEAEVNLMPMTQEGALVKLCDTISYVGRDVEDAIVLRLISRNQVPQTIFGSNYQQLIDRATQDIVAYKQKHNRIGVSQEVLEALQTLRAFNFDHIYYHRTLKTESKKIERAYELLFEALLSGWEKKGKQSIVWTHFLHSKSSSYLEMNPPARFVCDFIAGMTDGYFLRLYQELFFPRTIEVPHVLPFH